jgi:hypothetical protein
MGEVDRILEERTEETIRRMLNRAMASESLTATVQYKLVGKLCDTIDTASENALRQSSSLGECIEAARNNFVTESSAFRKSMGEIQISLEEFRKSNERASKALTKATYILAFVALVQAVILAYPLLK